MCAYSGLVTYGTCCSEGVCDHLNWDVDLTLSFPGYSQEYDGLAFNGIKEVLTKLNRYLCGRDTVVMRIMKEWYFFLGVNYTLMTVTHYIPSSVCVIT